MKRVLVGMALALICCTASAQDIQDKTDRFTGKRSIHYLDPPANNMSTIGVSSFITVEEAKEQFFLIISAYRSSRDGGWRYLRCNNTYWLADGVPVDVPDSLHDGSVVSGGVLEQIVQPLTLETMRTLASATTVEYKICNDEYTVTPQQMQGLRGVFTAYTTP